MSVDVMDELAHKTGQQGVSILHEAEGIVEAFVSGIGNKDHVGDIVESGAFDASLRRRKPRVIWGHEWNRPVGKVLEVFEVRPGDPKLPEQMRKANIGGLYVKVQFNLLTGSGREAFANVAFYGEEQQWSIGYKTIKSAYDQQKKAKRLIEVELFEVSPVLHGANQLTSTVSVKGADMAGTASHNLGTAGTTSGSIVYDYTDHGHSGGMSITPSYIPAAEEVKDDSSEDVEEKSGMMMSSGTRVLKETDDYVLILVGMDTMMAPKIRVGGEAYYGRPQPVDIQPTPLSTASMDDDDMNDQPVALKEEEDTAPIAVKLFAVEVLSEVDEAALASKMASFNVTVDGKLVVFNTVEAEADTKQLVASALESLGVTEIKPFRTEEGTN